MNLRCRREPAPGSGGEIRAAAAPSAISKVREALLVAYAGLLGLCSTLSVSVQPAPWPWLKLLSPSQRQQMPTKYSILCLCSAPTTWWT